jgi:VWFA-related protein
MKYYYLDYYRYSCRSQTDNRNVSNYFYIPFFITILISLAFCFHNAAFGQEKHEVTVQLVLVDLVATDRNGKAVRDLTKGDLEIFEDGRRIDIHSLDFIDLRQAISVPPGANAFSAARKSKLFVVFDSMNTIKRILDRSKSQIVEKLLGLIKSGYEVMVFELTEKGEMQILQSLTSDEQLIRQAVLKASGSLWVEHAEDVLGVPRFLLEDTARGNERFYQSVTRQMFQIETRRRFEASVTAFLSVLNVIKDLPGRKPVLLVSGGFPYFNIDEIQVAKINDPFQVLHRKKLTTTDEIFRHLISFANSHNISFYSLYSDDFLRYLLPDISLDNIKMTIDIEAIIKSEIYNLSDLAEGTMGVSMVGADKFQDFEQMIRSDLSSYYELSYVPPRNKADGRYHKIMVRTKRQDVILRHRQGYFDYDQDQKEAMLFASAALNPSLFQDILFAAKAVPVAVGQGRFILWLMMALPVHGFLLGEDETQEKKDIKICLNLLDDENNLALSARVNMPIKLSPEFRRRLTKARHFGFSACSQEVEFKKDRYRAVIALYDQDSGQMSTVECPLEVPKPSDEAEGSIVSVILGQVVESPDSRQADFSLSPEDGTLRLPGYKFYPMSLNELSSKERLAVFLQVRGAQDEEKLNLVFSMVRNGEVPVEIKSLEIARSKNKKANVWNVIFQLDLNLVSSGDHVLLIGRRGRPGEENTILFRLPLRLL